MSSHWLSTKSSSNLIKTQGCKKLWTTSNPVVIKLYSETIFCVQDELWRIFGGRGQFTVHKCKKGCRVKSEMYNMVSHFEIHFLSQETKFEKPNRKGLDLKENPR